MLVDKRYVHINPPYCPRPHPTYLWCKDQTVHVELEAKALGKAIIDDLSVEGYTRRHYSTWPANIRAAESAPAPVVEEAAPPSASVSTVLERALIVNQWTNTCDLTLRHIMDGQVSSCRESCMVDPSLRATAYDNWSDRSLECYDHIRHPLNGLGPNTGHSAMIAVTTAKIQE